MGWAFIVMKPWSKYANGAEQILLHYGRSKLAGLAFNLERDMLASSSWDGTIRLWPRKNRSDGGWTVGIQKTAHKLAFLDSKRLLLLEHNDVRLLDLDSQAMPARIFERVSRNLTDDEWRTALPTKPRASTCPALPLP